MLEINSYHPLVHSTLAFNLSINQGEIIGLQGHSGSGKTTFLRQLAGLSIPQKGFIKYNNDLWTNNGRVIVSIQNRNTGFVFQDYGLFPHLTALQNIEISKHPLSEEVKTALELAPFLHQNPGTLSGGQKQRTAIARALTTPAELLLLDEPFAALDDLMKTKTIELLNTYIKQKKITTIIVSHDTPALKKICSTHYTLKEIDGSTKLIQSHV